MRLLSLFEWMECSACENPEHRRYNIIQKGNITSLLLRSITTVHVGVAHEATIVTE